MAKKKFIVYSQYVIYCEDAKSAYSAAQAADMVMCAHAKKYHQEPGINKVMTEEEENMLMASREAAI